MGDDEQQHGTGSSELVEGASEVPGSAAAQVVEQANPLASAVGVTVAVPKSIRVQMVDASALSQFQLLGLATSILSSAAIGFLVAYLQSTRPTHLLVETIIWTVLFVIALTATMRTRQALKPESRDVPFGALAPPPGLLPGQGDLIK